jgi:hypothetical protein
MAVKKRRLRRDRIAQKAAELAPPEEQPAHARGDIHHDTNHANYAGNGNDGAILVDEGKLNLPKGLMESGDESGGKLFGLDSAVLFILALALAFIAFIAYLISQTE